MYKILIIEDEEDIAALVKLQGDISGFKLHVEGLTYSSSGFEVVHNNTISSRINSGFYQTDVAQTANGWPQTTNSWYHLISSTHSNQGNYFAMQIAGAFFDSNNFYIRSTSNNGLNTWRHIITDDGAGNVYFGNFTIRTISATSIGFYDSTGTLAFQLDEG